MASGIPKRIVVIKDIPSNFIEEAILILKSDPASNVEKGKGTSRRKKIDEDYLVKEAELIVNSYIKESKLDIGPKNTARLKFDMPKNKNKLNTIINLALFGSIALLIFIITRVI